MHRRRDATVELSGVGGVYNKALYVLGLIVARERYNTDIKTVKTTGLYLLHVWIAKLWRESLLMKFLLILKSGYYQYMFSSL